jgi:uncharacterized membrane protein YphA (DoxX/SURF4 family)
LPDALDGGIVERIPSHSPMTHSDASVTAPTTEYSPHSDRGTPAPSESREWSVAQRLGFRFAFIYVLLYTFPGPVDELPGVDFLRDGSNAFWRVAVPWFGAHVLRLSQPVSIRPSGSGDKLFDWVQVVAMLVLALIGAIVWTVVDRRRHRSHPKLLAGIYLYVRFTLASILFGYGFDKVIPNQFEPMGPLRLTQYIGEAAPGGFAWTFLGFSVMYEIFAGAGEVAAGVLLLFRRTTTLGAIVGAAVLTNVFMLNMSYDIPVKQFSFHLLLMAAALVAFDAPRLLNVFVRQRPAESPRYTELFVTPRSMRIARVAGALLGLWMIGGHFNSELRGFYQFGRGAPRGPLYGIFEVEQVVKNGAVQPALLTDGTRWRRLATSNRGAAVRFGTDSLVRYRLQTDTAKRTATLTPFPDTANKAVLEYAFPDTQHIVLRGRIGTDSVEMRLRRRSEASYLLVSRGFHWVNEVPYFR